MPPKAAEPKPQKDKGAGKKKGSKNEKAAGQKGKSGGPSVKGGKGGKGKSNQYPPGPPGISAPPGIAAPYWYDASLTYAGGWIPPPPLWYESESMMWAADPWAQKGKGKGPMVPWDSMWLPGGAQMAPTKGAKGFGKSRTKASPSFCQGEFWYASTSEEFDKIISTTGIDCSKGKHKGCVFFQRSREDAEATARKFKIGRVHKINVAAMDDYYSGPNGKGGVIWTQGPTTIDVSDLPPEDKNFVRPQFIESFEVSLQSEAANYSQQIIFNPLCVEDDKDTITADEVRKAAVAAGS